MLRRHSTTLRKGKLVDSYEGKQPLQRTLTKTESHEPLEWHTELRKPKDLKPWPLNPNKMTEEQFNELKVSIVKFNYTEPVIINLDEMIAAGHHRTKALVSLGRGDKPIEVRVPNRMLTGAEFRELALRDNRTGTLDKKLLMKHFERKELLDAGFMATEIDTKGEKFTYNPGVSNPKLSDAESHLFEKFMSPIRNGEDMREKYAWVNNILLDFSGGKDSTLVAYWFKKTFPDKRVVGIYSDTGVEIPGIQDHVMDVADWLGIELQIVIPEISTHEWLRKNGWPSLMFRQCQSDWIFKPLKKFKDTFDPKDSIVSDGGRKSQGNRGSKKGEFTPQQTNPKFQCFRPAFYLEEGTEHESLIKMGCPRWYGYDLGFVRTACWLCPGQCKAQALTLEKHFPGLAQEIRRMEGRYGNLGVRGGHNVSFDDKIHGRAENRQLKARKMLKRT